MPWCQQGQQSPQLKWPKVANVVQGWHIYQRGTKSERAVGDGQCMCQLGSGIRVRYDFWVRLWGCFWKKLACASSAGWVKKTTPTNAGRHHPISRGLESNKEAEEGEFPLFAGAGTSSSSALRHGHSWFFGLWTQTYSISSPGSHGPSDSQPEARTLDWASQPTHSSGGLGLSPYWLAVSERHLCSFTAGPWTIQTQGRALGSQAKCKTIKMSRNISSFTPWERWRLRFESREVNCPSQLKN